MKIVNGVVEMSEEFKEMIKEACKFPPVLQEMLPSLHRNNLPNLNREVQKDSQK